MSGVIECPSCGSAFPAGTRFCSECGSTMTGALVRQATGMLPPNRLLHERYLILKKLAQGGQSAVYLVADTLDQSKQYAIKEMSESELSPADRTQALADFQREADMLRLLNHPALAKVYATFVEDTKQYMVMEYIAGRNLEVVLAEAGKPLAEAQGCVWGLTICELLGYLHRQDPPIIYRDLKPSNIILKPDGSVKLIDFGIARFQQTGQSKDTVCLGTDGYAPIEQYSGRTEPRSDIYGLGATLYQLLTNTVPVAAPTRVADVASFLPPRQLNPAISPAMEAVILRAMEVHPTQRYADAEEMRAALAELSQSATSAQVSATSPATTSPTASRRPSSRAIIPVDPSRPVPVPNAPSFMVSAQQDQVTVLLHPARIPQRDRPFLRVRPSGPLHFGVVSAGRSHQRQFTLENEGAEPLVATITSRDPAVLLDVSLAQAHRAEITVWLKPYQLAARHFESAIDIVSGEQTRQLDVQFTVARPDASTSRALTPIAQNRSVYVPRPGRMIGLGIVLAYVIGYLLTHLGHTIGPIIFR